MYKEEVSSDSFLTIYYMISKFNASLGPQWVESHYECKRYNDWKELLRSVYVSKRLISLQSVAIWLTLFFTVVL